jgi:hypothetical protein
MYNAQFADAGSRSSFYIIDETRGFKEFESCEQAEYAHNVQKKLSQYNLAPKVYSEVGRIRIGKEKELSQWGFMTEIAEMLGCGGNDCGCGECDDVYEEKFPAIKRLHKKLEKIGINFADDHIGNIGYIRRRGRKVLVCIDTGEESIYDEDFSIGYDDYSGSCKCTYCQNHKGSY